jgi:F-box-like
MKKNSDKARKHKDPQSILDSFENLTILSNHGTSTSSSPQRRISRHTPSSSSQNTPINISTFMRNPSPEILAHIFSFLDPQGFSTASLVCKAWHSLATDDYAWKAAFDRFFGRHALISRLSSSWRGEYILRSQLHRYLTPSLSR